MRDSNLLENVKEQMPCSKVFFSLMLGHSMSLPAFPRLHKHEDEQPFFSDAPQIIGGGFSLGDT